MKKLNRFTGGEVKVVCGAVGVVVRTRLADTCGRFNAHWDWWNPRNLKVSLLVDMFLRTFHFAMNMQYR